MSKRHSKRGRASGKSGTRTAVPDELEDMRKALGVGEPAPKQLELDLPPLKTLPGISYFFKQDPMKVMMDLLESRDGAVEANMEQLKMGYSERKKFLKMWLEIDPEKANRVNRQQFFEYFNMIRDPWVERVFSIINSSFTGYITLGEFMTFCTRYLLVDLGTTVEFSFRMMSRRGGSFNRAHHSIIDVDDMKYFIQQRYAGGGLSKNKKRSIDIFAFINEQGDGGAEVDEFQKFCVEYPVFCKFTHLFQQHLRKCIFGIKYWVEKSRTIKLSEASMFDYIALGNSKINAEAEVYTVKKLGDPVIDGNGRPITQELYDASTDGGSLLASLAGKDSQEGGGGPGGNSVDDQSQSVEAALPPMRGMRSVKFDDAEMPETPRRKKFNKQKAMTKTKTMLNFLGTFTSDKIPFTKYEDDFYAVIYKKAQQRALKMSKRMPEEPQTEEVAPRAAAEGDDDKAAGTPAGQGIGSASGLQVDEVTVPDRSSVTKGAIYKHIVNISNELYDVSDQQAVDNYMGEYLLHERRKAEEFPNKIEYLKEHVNLRQLGAVGIR